MDRSALSKSKNRGRNCSTPEARVVQTLHDNIGTNSRRKSSEEGAKRNQRDVPQLAVRKEVISNVLIPEFPECLHVMANVAKQVSGNIVPRYS